MPRTNDNIDDVVVDNRGEITTRYQREQNRSYSTENMSAAVRDTSDTSRHFELNNTRDSASSRQSVVSVVNTHDSILDLESQCGDCDEDASFCDEDENMLGIMDNNNSILFDVQDNISGAKTKARAVSPSPSTNNEDKHSSNNPDNSAQKEHKKTPSIMDGLTLYSVTDSFVDSLCTSTACVVSENYTKTSNSNSTSMDDKISQFKQSCHSALFEGCKPQSTSPTTSKAVLSMDIWQLLGCSSPPGNEELEEIWSLRTTPEMLRNGQQSGNHKERNQPVRASIKRRLKRIHRLRMDDRRVSGASRHGVTITNHCIDPSLTSLNSIRNDIHMNKNSNSNADSSKNHQIKQPQNTQPSYRAIDKSYSMLDDPLADFIGQGMIEPIPVQGEEEDGYDSDPEVNYYSASSSMIMDSPTLSQSERMDSSSLSSSSSASSISPQHHEVLRTDPIPTDETEMKDSVQESLNSTWTLIWHPNAENKNEYNISHNKSICINMWIERGTVIAHSGVVVEPAFMWRDAYQPLLLSQHKLNSSTQKPWSMRLLNACRIIPYFSSSSTNNVNSNSNIDRTKYPLARQNASFLLKSCEGEEFLLEAKGPADAIAVTERWKLVVARFACLAVTDDVTGIANEFFHPTTSDLNML